LPPPPSFPSRRRDFVSPPARYRGLHPPPMPLLFLTSPPRPLVQGRLTAPSLFFGSHFFLRLLCASRPLPPVFSPRVFCHPRLPAHTIHLHVSLPRRRPLSAFFFFCSLPYPSASRRLCAIRSLGHRRFLPCWFLIFAGTGFSCRARK